MAITSLVRIMASMAMIIFAGAVVAGATGAFFSDTETSTGNTFTAGAIDLQIDNESYVTNQSGVLVASPNNTWGLSDLTNQLFFSFGDLKPEDIGEDTISIHAGSNDAWACMAVDITATPEGSLEDAEGDAGDIGPADGDNGELQNYLNFYFWHDDGDNVFENNESTFMSGTAGSLFDGTWKTIADGGTATPLAGGESSYVGKAWCFGALTPSAIAQDDEGKTGTNGPLARGTGFTCSGAGDQNDAQSDGIVADVSFYAEQARNNTGFTCASLTPIGEEANINSVNPNTVDPFFSPEIGPTLLYTESAFLGRTVTYTGPALGSNPDSIQWRITIDGPGALSPSVVELDEVGFDDPGGDGNSIGTFHYPFQVVDADTIRATGSCSTEGLHDNGCATDAFSLDANDVFTNADKLTFTAGAPTGTYTIKYELVNTAGGAVLGTHVVMVTVI